MTALCLLAVFFVSKNADAVGVEVGNGTFTLSAGQNVFYGVTSATNANGNFLLLEKGAGNSVFQVDKDGNLTTSGTISGASLNLTGALSAGNISSGAFGSNTGGGNYSFPGNVGIGTSNPTTKLEVDAPNVDSGPSNALLLINPSNTGNAGASILFGGPNPSYKTGQIRGALVTASAGGTGKLIFGSINSGVSNDELTLSGGNVGIATAYPGYKLDVAGTIRANTGAILQQGTVTSSSAGISLLGISGTLNGSNSSQQQIIAAQATVSPNVGGTLGALYGMIFLPTLASSTDNITNIYAMFARTDLNATYTGTITNYNGFYASNPIISGGAITNIYGYRGAISSGANKYNLYLDGSAQNYIAGNVGIGTTNPGAKLEVNQGGAIKIGSSVDDAAIYDASTHGTQYMSTDATPNFNFWSPGVSQLTFYNSGGTVDLSLSGNLKVLGTGNSSIAGNVGIGTTTPAYKLDVRASGASYFDQPVFVGTPTAAGHAATKNYVDSVLSGGSGSTVGYWAMNGTNISNSNSGNVGIGTTAPNAKLTIGTAMGGTALGSTLTTNSGSLGQLAGNKLTLANIGFTSTNQSSLGVRAYRTAAGSDWNTTAITLGMDVDDTVNAGSYLTFGTSAIGIGTTNPSGLLNIVGNNSSGELNVLNNTATNYTTAIIQQTVAGGNGNQDIGLVVNTQGAADTDRIVNFGYYNAGTPISRFVVTRGGNVGIGTTAPSGAQLHIKQSGSSYGIKYEAIGGDTSVIGYNPSSQFVIDTLTGGNRQIVLNPSGGNVGIGTTTPAYKLDVRGATASYFDQPVFVGTPTAASHAATKNYVDSVLGGGSLWTASGSNIYNSNAGNVGIGTTNPTSLLHISGVASGISDVGIAIDSGNTARHYKIYNGSAVGDFRIKDTYDNVDRLTIDEAGYVGIGTTNPQTQFQMSNNSFTALTVESSSNTDYFRADFNHYRSRGTLAAKTIVQNGDWLGLQRFLGYNGADYVPAVEIMAEIEGGTPSVSSMPGSLSFLTTSPGATVATERMRINYAGNVGIGSTNPAYKLDVRASGASYFDQPVFVGTPTAAGHAATKNYVDSVLSGGSGSTVGYWTMNGTNISNSNGGNVGIGTSTPNTQLSIFANNASGIASGLSIRNISTTAYANAMLTNDLGNFVQLIMSDSAYNWGATGGDTATLVSGGTGGLNLVAYNASGKISFVTGADSTSNERMRITSGGNVGIGTTTPGAYKLYVNGDTNINGSVTATTYVGGAMTGTVQARNVTSGEFGLTGGGGNFLFGATVPGNVGIGTDTPTTEKLVIANGGLDLASAANSPAGDNGLGLSYESYGGRIQSFGGKPLILNPLSNNVGIGVTTPSAKLELNAGANPAIRWDYDATNYPSDYYGQVGFYGAGAGQDSLGGVQFLSQRGASGNYYDFVTKLSTSTAVSRMVIDSNGNVGIGTTTPTATLHVNGGMKITNGDLTIVSHAPYSNLTVDKITVGTVDPLYNIRGTNYASFAASIVGGVKEEVTGKINIDTKVGAEYEYTIDFDTQAKGTDLWVWRQVIDFSKDNIEAQITPYGKFANTYYTISGNKIIIKSDRPVEVSYRLIAKRFDWQKWPTLSVDQTEKANLIIK